MPWLRRSEETNQISGNKKIASMEPHVEIKEGEIMINAGLSI